MAFEPKKQNATDFHGGVKYENEKDGVEAETINNLIEGLLFAQENGGSGGDIDLSNYVTFDDRDTFVKEGLVETEETWTADDKTKACGTIGARQKFVSNNKRVVYTAEANGTQGTVPVATVNALCSNGNLAQYHDPTYPYGDGSVSGTLLTADPTKPYHCANKKYVDEYVANAGATDSVFELIGTHTLAGDTSTFELGFCPPNSGAGYKKLLMLAEFPNGNDQELAIRTIVNQNKTMFTNWDTPISTYRLFFSQLTEIIGGRIFNEFARSRTSETGGSNFSAANKSCSEMGWYEATSIESIKIVELSGKNLPVGTIRVYGIR